MNISLKDRILGLSVLWKEASYNFAYMDERTDLDWDNAYYEALARILDTSNAYEYYLELMRFISLLKDGHSYVIMPDEIAPAYQLPAATGFLENKHILSMVPKEYSFALGSEILSINDRPIDKYLNEIVYPYIWHEKPESIFRHGLLGYYISCFEKSPITIHTNNGTLIFNKEDEPSTAAFKYLAPQQITEMKEIFTSQTLTIWRTADNIAYIQIWTFSSGDLKKELYESISEIKDCVGFIIDVRNNGGGSSNNSNCVVQLFFENEFKSSPSKSPVNISSYRAYGQYRDLGSTDMNDPWQKKIYDVCTNNLYEEETDTIKITDCPCYLEQPVVILSGPDTASAAESFLVDMKQQNRGVIIGMRSYGSNGQPLMGELPGGGKFGICTQKCYMHDGTEYNNIGIQPDIYVEETVEDNLKGYDRTFNAGLVWLREHIV